MTVSALLLILAVQWVGLQCVTVSVLLYFLTMTWVGLQCVTVSVLLYFLTMTWVGLQCVTVSVLWFLFMVRWVGLQCVIVVFLDHTHCFLHSLPFLCNHKSKLSPLGWHGRPEACMQPQSCNHQYFVCLCCCFQLQSKNVQSCHNNFLFL